MQIDFTEKVYERLVLDPCDTGLSTEILGHINYLPLPQTAITAPKRRKLEASGRLLWNLATTVTNETHNAAGNKRDTSALQVFSYFLLDSAHHSGPGTNANEIRLLRTALKTARCCLDEAHDDLCTKVLERAAYYEDSLIKEEDMTFEEKTLVARLRVDYYATRATLVCDGPTVLF